MLGKKREMDVLVISDIHLGTYGCQANELLQYLRSIDPKKVVLNGDIIDIWQFSKHYFPKAHMLIVQHFVQWIVSGKEVYYVTGNHDEMLRKFKGMEMNNFSIVNKVVLNLENDEKAWIFHGDVFDVTMKHSKWLAKLGGKGYELLIMINNLVNWFSKNILGKGKISLSKKIKNSVKGAVKHINNFEMTAAEIAVENGYDYVICGHIHQPEIRKIKVNDGEVTYLNSGDWIENLTALEYNNSSWSIYRFEERGTIAISDKEKERLDNDKLFEEMLEEFNLVRNKKTIYN